MTTTFRINIFRFLKLYAILVFSSLSTKLIIHILLIYVILLSIYTFKMKYLVNQIFFLP